MKRKEMLSTDGAFWHCMSLVLGLGTLTMPHALKQLGWFGIPILGFLAWLSAHTAKLLCKCVDYKADLVSYPDIGQAAFGENGRSFVNFILYTDLVASSALFLVFIATNLHELFADAETGFSISRSGWICLVTISLLPTVHMKLNKLTYLSKLGSYIMILLVVGVLYAAITAPKTDLDQNEYDIYKFEMGAIGNMVFAFSCHGTLLTIYRQMEHPEDVNDLFDKVYASGYLLKFLVGATGYYVFAQGVSDQISLNIPNQYIKIAVTVFVTAKKWLTYALPLEPVAVDFTEMMGKERKKSTKKDSFLIRTFLVFLTGLLAFFLPYFGLFQSLVGALCAGFLVLLFPIGFYLKLYGHELTLGEKRFHVALLVISSVLVLISASHSLTDAHVKWVQTMYPSDEE